MQMTNAELAALLNTELGLVGRDSVTVNVVRQWVDWDVLPKATVQGRIAGKGPAWSRSGVVLRRAMRLGELRKRGIRRQNALIVQAYVEWGHNDFDRVKEALQSEWTKWATQLTRRQTTSFENSEYRELSAKKKSAIANQLGPLDYRFGGTQFQQSGELYAIIAELAREGVGDTEQVESLLTDAFRQVAPEIAGMLPPHCMGALANSFAGMTGAPDEIDNSGESTIRAASELQFRIARHPIRLFLRELRKGDEHTQSATLSPNGHQLWQMLHLLSPQISTGPWLVFSFVQALKTVAPR